MIRNLAISGVYTQEKYDKVLLLCECVKNDGAFGKGTIFDDGSSADFMHSWSTNDPAFKNCTQMTYDEFINKYEQPEHTQHVLAKADRLDGKGSVEGYYVFTSGLRHVIIKSMQNGKTEINPQTLKYSFDNGASWFSECEIRDKLQQDCTTCSLYDIKDKDKF